MFRESSKSFGNHIGREVVGFLQTHPDCHLTHHGGARDCRGTPIGEPPQVSYGIILDLDQNLHLVATGQGTDFTDSICLEIFFFLPGIPGIHKMVFHHWGVDPLTHKVGHRVDISLNRLIIGGSFSST